ncbi:MAG: SEC-C domain-containing protein [Mariprofundus sp.]
MARKVQRNEPCPCGSGKKYKKCCMVSERDQMTASVGRREGVQHALGWVSKNYREQIERWVEDVWLAGISDDQRQGIGQADATIRSIHDVNLLEELVAEGHFADMEGENSPLQLILGASDLVLDEGQRDYLTQLATRPLHLYVIERCQPGESFSVRDLQDDAGDVITIADAYGSRMFDVGDTAGLRLIQTPAGWETSGAIYHIPAEYLAELQASLQQAEKGEYAALLINYWLKLVAAHV